MIEQGGPTPVLPARRTIFKRKIYETKKEKSRDFWIGVIGWVILNVVLWGLSTVLYAFLLQYAVSTQFDPSVSEFFAYLPTFSSCLPLLINILLITFFAFTRRWIALGALAAFGAAFVLAIIAGIVLTVACFLIFNSAGSV